MIAVAAPMAAGFSFSHLLNPFVWGELSTYVDQYRHIVTGRRERRRQNPALGASAARAGERPEGGGLRALAAVALGAATVAGSDPQGGDAGTNRSVGGEIATLSVGPPDPSNCGTVIKSVTADGAGNFSVPVVIDRIIAPGRLGGGPVDCADPVRTCVFAAARLDLSGLVTVNLDFAPAPPVILPGAASVLEGNSGTSSTVMPLTLSYASSSTVTVNWATTSAPGAPFGQADPGTDFTPASGTVTFAPGNTSQSVTISVNGDTLVEPDEAIVSFSHVTNATVGTFAFPIIVNDDHATVLPGGAMVAEGNSATTNLLVPLTLSNPSVKRSRCNGGRPPWRAHRPLRTLRTDFTVASGVVTFAPGETAKTVTISVNGDTVVEPDEWIVVAFNHPTNAKMGGFWGLGFGVILNDD